MGHERAASPSRSFGALVAAVVEARRAAARAQAEEARLLAEAVDLVLARLDERRSHEPRRRSDADLPLREVAAELAAAMRVSDRTVQRRMGDASHLVGCFPTTLAAWENGLIDSTHVTAILDSGVGIEDDQSRRRFEERALDVALTETAARLRAAAPAIAAQIDPAGVEGRMRRRAAERRVRVFDLDNGQARLLADLPATLAHAIYDRLTRMADAVRDGDDAGHVPGDGAEDVDVETADRAHTGTGTGTGTCTGTGTGTEANPELRRDAEDEDEDVESVRDLDGRHRGVLLLTGPSRSVDGDQVDVGAAGTTSTDAVPDVRTMDQLRADILCDLVLAGGTVAHGDGLESVTGHVQVTIPARALAEGNDHAGLLAGSGTVAAEAIRRLAANAVGWDRVFTDPLNGAVLAVDRYRPSAELKRFLRARDETCRFPGCRRAARGCDIDHTHDAARGGATRADNLAHLCRRHHTLKHESEWTVRQRRGGVIEWRSPLGRLYRDRPPAVVRFALAKDGPPPF